MNGPEHYREAERLLLDCDRRSAASGLPAADVMAHVAAAQVHATLALAAAQARIAIAGSNSDSANEWRAAVHGVTA